MSFARVRTRSDGRLRSYYVYCGPYGGSNPVIKTATATNSPIIEQCADTVHKVYPYEGSEFYKSTDRVDRGSLPIESGYWLRDAQGNWSVDWSKGLILSEPAGNYQNSLPTQAQAVSSAKSFGAEAWDRMAPTLSRISLGEGIAEIRDSLKMIQHTLQYIKHIKRIPKDGGFKRYLKGGASAWLSWNFGWLPLVRDLRDLCYLIRNKDKIMLSAQKANNRWVRKRFVLRDTESVTTTGPFTTVRVVPTTGKTNHSYFVDRTFTEKVWCSGLFRYYVPGLGDTSYIGRVKDWMRLGGAEITPSLLWRITPWSWLADWFSNADHVINNYTHASLHHVVAKYAYVMRTTREKLVYRYSFTNKLQRSYVPGGPRTITITPAYVESSKMRETKTRVQASPYGFSVDWPSFSSWQVSILTALGITRTL